MKLVINAVPISVFVSTLALAGCLGANPSWNPENDESDDGSALVEGDVDGGIPDSEGQPPLEIDASSPPQPPDAGAPDTPDMAPAKGTGAISIYLKGDFTPKVFTDTLASQTITEHRIAISEYWIQTSLNDPSPVLCFDHGKKPVVAEMEKDNLMGACKTNTIPTASYTHGRVKVDWIKFSVTGTVHFLSMPYPGSFTVFRAYSDTAYEGKNYTAGQGKVNYVGIIPVELPVSYDPLPVVPGLKMEVDANGDFWIVFPFGKSLLIVQNNNEQHWARFHWQMYEGFRWLEHNAVGYADNTWDVSPYPGATEEVISAGVTGFYITASTD
jgi:hypothetical protein